ncbi:hypothetical protein [Actinomadura rugatobispora]|uniref:ParB/Sulfiredoxin domain-containing protein n=1 Tax=Actinomadura rugatobispora TaxID=1994 RepID=A0ABW0ZR85_9ACTN|nr:hypothetical protein GCM10010200_044500 [Actinomadura rugatobispora]
MRETANTQDLPPDNASRLAIYDAVHEYVADTDSSAITDIELFGRVIGRLRVLVPRELHLAGDSEYVNEKVQACVQAGILITGIDNGTRTLSLTGRPPLVRYPDGEIRKYTPGLEPARERLDRDNTRLRAAGFDVRKFIPSIADKPEGGPFQALLSSMREHGFMKQFPVVEYEDGTIVDGLARRRAATILQLDVEYLKYGSEKERKAAHLRDMPLNRILIAVHSNIGRLQGDVVDAVHESASEVTGRAWDETAADLALTQEWRHSRPSEYTPRFEVTRLAYREGEDPKVQVTADHKVMVRSLVEAGGLASYKIDTQLSRHVPFERARSAYSGGRKAYFARAEDLIAGITAMQQERRAARRKTDPEWEQIREWLVRTFGPTQD